MDSFTFYSEVKTTKCLFSLLLSCLLLLSLVSFYTRKKNPKEHDTIVVDMFSVSSSPSFVLASIVITVVSMMMTMMISSSSTLAAPVYAGVRRDTSHFATGELRSRFATSVITSLASMLETTATTTTVPPSGGKTARERLLEAIGTVECVDVAEVNDTFTNVQLECANKMTADAIIEAANVVSWNAIKSSGIVLASVQGPSAETQGARTVVFFAIVTIVAVVCAGLASWCVRRRAIEKHRGISFSDLANLEEELYKKQEDTVHQQKQQVNNVLGVGAASSPMNQGNFNSSNSRGAAASFSNKNNVNNQSMKKSSSSRNNNNNSSSRRR